MLKYFWAPFSQRYFKQVSRFLWDAQHNIQQCLSRQELGDNQSHCYLENIFRQKNASSQTTECTEDLREIEIYRQRSALCGTVAMLLTEPSSNQSHYCSLDIMIEIRESKSSTIVIGNYMVQKRRQKLKRTQMKNLCQTWKRRRYLSHDMLVSH